MEEFHADHQAFAADFADEAEFGGKLREALAQLRAEQADIFESSRPWTMLKLESNGQARGRRQTCACIPERREKQHPPW